MTDINTAHYRAIAQAATPGEWRQHLVDDTTIISEARDEICCTFPAGGFDDDADFAAPVEQHEANAAHIAAFSPATALALLDELDRLRAEAEWQPIETAPEQDEFVGFGWYLYPGDKNPTIYYSIACRSGDPQLPWEDEEGKHPPGFFTHWRALKPPHMEERT